MSVLEQECLEYAPRGLGPTLEEAWLDHAINS